MRARSEFDAVSVVSGHIRVEANTAVIDDSEVEVDVSCTELQALQLFFGKRVCIKSRNLTIFGDDAR